MCVVTVGEESAKELPVKFCKKRAPSRVMLTAKVVMFAKPFDTCTAKVICVPTVAASTWEVVRVAE